MSDDEINDLVLDFLEARGGYVAGASERELFLMLKNALAAQRERDAQIADSYLEMKRVFDDDGSKNYHAGFIDGALTVREAIRDQS